MAGIDGATPTKHEYALFTLLALRVTRVVKNPHPACCLSTFNPLTF